MAPNAAPVSDVPVRQVAVEAVIFRARGCGAMLGSRGHGAYTDGCPLCERYSHCDSHTEFVADCADCRARKDPEDLGTVAHYHVEPEKTAPRSLLGIGRRIWRR